MVVDTAQWSRSKEWTVANGADTCSITLEIGNNTNASMDNYLVEFSIDNPIFGTLNPPSSYTISNKTSTIFTSKYKSGTAIVTGKVLFKENDLDPNEPFKNRTWSTEIKIDHDNPFQRTSYSVPSEMNVGSSKSIRLAYADQWGNPVDNRRITEQVYFQIGYSPNNTALFVGASPPYTAISIPVDSTGNATAQFQASTAPGPNMIIVHPEFLDQQDDYFYINAIANSSPVAIEQQFDPDGYLGNPPKQYADGISLYQIIYTLRDQYGNGVMNSPISISTTIPGEDAVVYTNAQGKALMTYGPKTSVGKITITAKSLVSPTVLCHKEVWFISQEPIDMQFTAIPESMASRDVIGWEPGQLLAKVIDENGNPVPDELVTFSLGIPDYHGETYNVTMEPDLSAFDAISDINGYAIVNFLPGAFTTNWTDLNHSQTASGDVLVTAHWENNASGRSATHNVTVSWKNYPYLSLETEVFPQTVNVTDTVDVWIRLKGDGYALRPDPIDVVLIIDRSGSMSGTDISPNRMQAAKNAAKDFVGNMDLEPGRDRVAIMSFASDVQLNQGLTDNGATANSSIDSLSAFGATIMRRAYYDGIKYLKENGRPGAVKAVVMMTDGDWNLHGNPLARGIGFPDNGSYLSVLSQDYEDTYGIARSSYPWSGSTYSFDPLNCIVRNTEGGSNIRVHGYEWYNDLPDSKGSISIERRWWERKYPIWDWKRGYVCTDGLNTNQNMSVYANSGTNTSKVKVYSIGFAQNLNDNVETDLTILSEATKGWYQWAGNEQELIGLYRKIAGELKEEASVNTNMDLNFEQVEVNYNIVLNEGDTIVFDYVHLDDNLEEVSTWIHSYNETHTIVPAYYEDQSEEWSTTNKLTFPIGSIKLHQIWEARYRLRVLTDGNINIFGPGSTISFGEGDPTYLLLPKTYITGVPGMVSTGVNTSVLNITNVSGGSESDPQGIEYMVWTWDRHYTGVMNVTEQYFISNDGGMQWILIGSKNLSSEEANQPGEFRYQKNLLPAGVILFKVVANAEDAPGPVVAAPPPPETSGPPTFKPYIVLK
ncbi:MAG TPA: VWA domain-containing protein [Methanolinea sp.]|jgi:hypothetical protein|nr:VWA domain-containing protein [Methanolinea sp.]